MKKTNPQAVGERDQSAPDAVTSAPDKRKPRKESLEKPRSRMFPAFLLVVAVLLVVIIAAIASRSDMVQPEPSITAETLREQLEYVKDLVTVEYYYTDAEKQELPGKKLFNAIPMPFTKKTLIISYDGVIKYGVDVSQVGLSVNGIAKTVTVEIPKAKIISHEIPEEGFHVLYESSGPFNKISIDDVTRFRMVQKDKMENKAEEKDMPRKAQEQSGDAIFALLKAVPGMEEYTLEVEYAQ